MKQYTRKVSMIDDIASLLCFALFALCIAYALGCFDKPTSPITAPSTATAIATCDLPHAAP